jgi:GT2 family glycosyltransferase
MKTAVIVSSVNRPQVLHETVLAIGRQTVSPLAIILSLCDARSVLPETSCLPAVTIVQGQRGLTRQRNAGLSAVPSAAEYVLFLDDDTELAPNYLESMERLFDGRSDVAVASAIFAIDGLRIGRPLTREEAMAAILRQSLEQRTEPADGLTGCNIFVRRAVVETVRFDERLPLSGWLEDFDFSVRSRPHGMVVWNFETCVAHFGVQRASRERGFLVGYAQVANSYYLCKKGVIPSFGKLLGTYWLPMFRLNFHGLLRCALHRNSAWNLVFDHPGRMAGNARALMDAALHRLRPERLLDFV